MGFSRFKGRASLGQFFREFGQYFRKSGQFFPQTYTSYITLDVEVLHIQGVVLDELPSCLNVFTHQGGEDGFGLRNVLELNLQ